MARQASPSRRRHEKAGQIGLFDRDDYIEGPPRRYESGGLVMADDGLFARAVSPHSAAKAAYARSYAGIVGERMRGKWRSLWWIELFAGPGRLYVRETGEFVPGSPLEALSILHPFSGYVFADLSESCSESLRRRVGSDPRRSFCTGTRTAPRCATRSRGSFRGTRSSCSTATRKASTLGSTPSSSSSTAGEHHRVVPDVAGKLGAA